MLLPLEKVFLLIDVGLQQQLLLSWAGRISGQTPGVGRPLARGWASNRGGMLLLLCATLLLLLCLSLRPKVLWVLPL